VPHCIQAVLTRTGGPCDTETGMNPPFRASRYADFSLLVEFELETRTYASDPGGEEIWW
jgi:hypothetical protein